MSALLLLAAATVPLNYAQTASTVRILSDPDGPWFYVDGTVHFHAFAALWPAGSVHQLYVPSREGYATNPDNTIQWRFTNWQWSGGTLTTNPLTVIADPAITEYRAMYETSYKYEFHIVCDPAPCTTSPGKVTLNGAVIEGDSTGWERPGTSKTYQVFPNDGWTFAGWTSSSSQTVIGFQTVVTINAPTVINAVFIKSKQINLVSNPSDLHFYVDRTEVTPPLTFAWGQGTTHTLSSIDVQLDNHGKRWIFASWSDGGAMSHDYMVSRTSAPETIVANFTPAAYPLFTTVPINLRLVVDNQTLPPPYAYIWGVGTTHKVSAPPTQIDSDGRTWVFKSWDDLVTTPTRDVTIPVGADDNGFRLTALYTQQARLTVGSSIAGLTATVDGTTCTTPCSVYRDQGTQVKVTVPASLALNDGSRQDFLNWTGGGTSTQWVGTLGSLDQSIFANYHLMNKLSLDATPPDGASWTVQPASTDGFYDAQTLVSIGVAARPGFRFKGWTGDLSGSVPSGALTMSSPHAVVAQFGTVPYISSTGVSNAAGELPQPGVTAGSIASVFGASLGGTTAIAPPDSLPQTLGGIAVHIADRLLPLYYVSPTQINLQIPPDLPVGKYTMTVSSVTMPDVSADFVVVRDAPGLFPFTFGEKKYALVLHEDGRLVTPVSPAKIGELLTAYGTGFGPTTLPRLLATPVPANPEFRVVDPVTIGVNDAVFPADKAFAAAGQIGLDLVQFRLDGSTPTGAEISLTVAVNGVKSNSLLLPVQ